MDRRTAIAAGRVGRRLVSLDGRMPSDQVIGRAEAVGEWMKAPWREWLNVKVVA